MLKQSLFICSKYTNIPNGCTEVKKAGDCNTSIKCSTEKLLASTGNQCYFIEIPYFSCSKYTNIPSGCTEVKKTGDCSTSVQCSYGKFLL